MGRFKITVAVIILVLLSTGIKCQDERDLENIGTKPPLFYLENKKSHTLFINLNESGLFIDSLLTTKENLLLIVDSVINENNILMNDSVFLSITIIYENGLLEEAVILLNFLELNINKYWNKIAVIKYNIPFNLLSEKEKTKVRIITNIEISAFSKSEYKYLMKKKS